MSLFQIRKTKRIFTVLLSAVFFTACARNVGASEAETPREAAEQVMCSIKELDLKTFNALTDNYEGTCRSFLGLSAGKEYKVFQELLTPHIFESRRYKEKYRFAGKAVENLTWEIGRIKEKDGGRKAAIEMSLTNKDMAEAMEKYTLWIIEDTMKDVDSKAISLIGDISWAVNMCDDDLIRFIDETENTWTEDVTVTAYKEGGVWKLQLTDEFINAFMGNIDSEEYEDRLDERIDELMEEFSL